MNPYRMVQLAFYCSGGKPFIALLAVTLLSLGTLIMPQSVGAADDGTLTRNLTQTMLVRQALANDPLLGALNIGVRVENRIATIFGPVPSEAIRKQAEQTVRLLPDIYRVQNQLFIDDFELQSLPQQFAASMKPDVTQALATKHPPATAKSEVPKPDLIWKPALPSFSKQPASSNVESAPNRPLSNGDTRGEGANRIALNPTAAQPTKDIRFRPASINPGQVFEESEVLELPAIRVPSASKQSGKTVLASGETSIESAVQKLLHTNAHYRWLTVDIKDGRVHLSGKVEQTRDVHLLAAAIARISGVEGVVIGRIVSMESQR